MEHEKRNQVTGTPRLALGVGTVARAVDMAHAWDRGIAFIYVVQAGDLDSDGISIAADALTLNGAQSGTTAETPRSSVWASIRSSMLPGTRWMVTLPP